MLTEAKIEISQVVLVSGPAHCYVVQFEFMYEKPQYAMFKRDPACARHLLIVVPHISNNLDF